MNSVEQHHTWKLHRVLTLHQALRVFVLFYHSRSKLLDVATKADGPVWVPTTVTDTQALPLSDALTVYSSLCTENHGCPYQMVLQ